MSNYRIIVVGASAGGVEALIKLVQGFPTDLPVAVFVVLHIAPTSYSVLPHILSKNGSLPAKHPTPGEKIQLGQIYIAPPNYHLLVKDRETRLIKGPKENGHRPAIDPLFRSAAQEFGRRVIGVVLSGNRDDGTAGLVAIKRLGGVTIAQSPTDALYDSMPRSAIQAGVVDHIVPVTEIPVLIAKLANEPMKPDGEPVDEEVQMETDAVQVEMDALRNLDRIGNRSTFACPDCGGTLWELDDGRLTQFRCHVGHAYSAETLIEKQSEGLEEALWVALRTLEEQVALSNQLARRARDRNQKALTARFQARVNEAEQRAVTIRRFLLNGEGRLETELGVGDEGVKS